MQPVLLERLGRQRPERVEPDVQRDSLDIQPRQQFGSEVKTRRGRRRRAWRSRVDGLVALRVAQGLHDVRRQRHLAGRLPPQPHSPAALPARLEELDRTEPFARPKPPRRAGERFPDAVLAGALEQEHLRGAAARALQPQPRRDDARVVDDDHCPLPHLLGELGEQPVTDRAGPPLEDQKPRAVAPLGRVLRDQLRRELVLEIS